MENYPMSWMARLGKHHERRSEKTKGPELIRALFYDSSIIFLFPALYAETLGSAAFPLRWRKGHRRFTIREESIIYVATWLLRLRFSRLSFDLSIPMNSSVSFMLAFHLSLYRVDNGAATVTRPYIICSSVSTVSFSFTATWAATIAYTMQSLISRFHRSMHASTCTLSRLNFVFRYITFYFFCSEGKLKLMRHGSITQFPLRHISRGLIFLRARRRWAHAPLSNHNHRNDWCFACEIEFRFELKKKTDFLGCGKFSTDDALIARKKTHEKRLG